MVAASPADGSRRRLVDGRERNHGEDSLAGKEAIGQCIQVNADTMPCTYVVGIAENVVANQPDRGHRLALLHADRAVPPAARAVSSDAPATSPTSREAIRRELQREMPGASYVTVTPIAELVDGQQRSWKLGATMFVAFGVLALLVAHRDVQRDRLQCGAAHPRDGSARRARRAGQAM